jgi:hypothetical protein
VSVKAFYHEQAVTVDGEVFRLVINFRAIDATESLLQGRAYNAILGEMLSGSPPIGLQARVVWGLLREHHPELTLDDAGALALGPAAGEVGLAIGKLFMAAFPSDDGKKAKGKNPPRRRGA